MAFRVLTLLAVGGTVAFAANPTQPAISPNGVVNAAGYLAPGFANAGIARGSLFLIFGNYLGPDSLVQAASFPLPTSDGRPRQIDPCPMSTREVEVLRRLARGMVYKQIATELGLSTSTVRTHLHNVYGKLGAMDRAQAVLIATERGWI